MIVGIDARPALFGRSGFARVAAQTVEALARRPDVEVRAYGAAWRKARPGLQLPGMVRRRWPARLQALAAPFGFGVESLLGRIDVYQHTDVVFAPVRRAPEVVTLYDTTFLQDESWHDAGFRARVEPRVRMAAARAAAVVVPCVRVAEEARRAGLCRQAHVVPFGADHIEARGQPQDGARLARLLGETRRFVLLPGTREPRKNQLALVSAFLGLDTDARLVLAGPAGWRVDELESLLASEPRVLALGEVEEEDYQVLMRAADLVAYPSFAEGFGLPVAEAMRCGRAVLTSLDTPMADYGGDAVLAVDPRDPNALRDALKHLLDDPAAAADLGRRAAARIAPFTWDATAAALKRVYESVV